MVFVTYPKSWLQAKRANISRGFIVQLIIRLQLEKKILMNTFVVMQHQEACELDLNITGRSGLMLNTKPRTPRQSLQCQYLHWEENIASANARLQQCRH